MFVSAPTAMIVIVSVSLSVSNKQIGFYEVCTRERCYLIGDVPLVDGCVLDSF